MDHADAHRDPEDVNGRGARAAQLKERVYITFTALSVVLALRSHPQSAGAAAATLAIAVFGTLLAVFLADVVSHVSVHAALPDRHELRHMAHVSFGALGVIVVPFIFIGLAAAGVWSIKTGLHAAAIGLVVSLIAIGFAAIRRTALPAWQRLVVLFAEFLLGAAVIGLEVLAHG